MYHLDSAQYDLDIYRPIATRAPGAEKGPIVVEYLLQRQKCESKESKGNDASVCMMGYKCSEGKGKGLLRRQRPKYSERQDNAIRKRGVVAKRGLRM